MIKITNNSESSVYIRISSQSGSDTEDHEISPGSSYSWQRTSGDYCLGLSYKGGCNDSESTAIISSPCEAEIDSTSLLRSYGMHLPYSSASFNPTRYSPSLGTNEISSIEIRNNYPMAIYVRVGGDDGEGLKYIPNGDSGIFYRKGGAKYNLQVVFNESDPALNQQSKIYTVFPPCVYMFVESSESGMEGVIELRDEYGNYVSSGWKKFDS